MNLTHNNEKGCRMTAEAGGLEAAAGLFAALAQSEPSASAYPSTQDSRGLPMTGAQLMDSQTSTSGTAFSQPDNLASDIMPEAEANGCQPPCDAMPAALQPCASLQNLLMVCWTLQIHTVPARSSSCISSPRQQPHNLKQSCSYHLQTSDALFVQGSLIP